MPCPTKEELDREKKILQDLKEELLHVFIDAGGYLTLNSYNESRNPDLKSKKKSYRISTLRGDFEITHHTGE